MWKAITDSIMQTCRNTFGEPIILQSRVGPPQELIGIFEEVTDSDDLTSSAALTGASATIEFRTCDLTFIPAREDMIIIKSTGQRYKLIKTESDGWALTRFYLREFL